MNRYLSRPHGLIHGALLVLPLAAHAADSTAAPSSSGSLLQVLFGLVVVLGLLAGAAWLMKRSGAMRPAAGTVARIVGGVSVGTRERVVVIEVGEQWVVVGVAPGQVNALATMPRQETPAAQAGAQAADPNMPPFAAWLKKTIEKRGNGN
jgi:flagellar protein FliO/FliZ